MLEKVLTRKFIQFLKTDNVGAASILFGIIIPVLIGFTGMGIDAVYWYMERNKLQAATDQAVISAAHVLRTSQDVVDIASGANHHLQKLYTAEFPTLSVQINSPPTTGAQAGNNLAVELLVQKPQPVFFLQLFQVQNVSINSRAVSLVTDEGENCLLGLSKTEDRAVEFSGSVNVDLNCGIASNSESGESAYFSGNSQVTTTGVTAVGDIVANSAPQYSSDDARLRPFSPPVIDPYGPEGRNLQVPSFPTACTSHKLTLTNDTVLSPGRYCGGLSVHGGNITLQPGTYIIDGGNFKANGTANISGNDVTIVLTGNGSKYAKLDIEAGVELSLSAPSSGGSLDGVVIFQDPQAPTYQGSNVNRNKILGNANLSLSGAIYIPKQEVLFSGGSGGAMTCLQLVGYKLTISGDTRITDNCDASTGAATISQSRIKVVE